MTNNIPHHDPMIDFDQQKLTINGIEKVVYTSGAGPAVIVMPEMPGISPHIVRFARWVRDAGLTVYMPSLYGKDGETPSAEEGVAIFQRVCVSAEFQAFAANRSSPVTQWLRGLARLAHEACGGPGVGAIGMCFTGNFALSMMLEQSVLAPVLSQPSLPLDDPGALEISQEDLRTIRARLEEEDLHVLAYRFEDDPFCMAQRFHAYRKALGDRFIGHSIEAHAANTDNIPPFFKAHVPQPHSVVTVHLIDEAGEPTARARDEILAFFQRVLCS